MELLCLEMVVLWSPWFYAVCMHVPGSATRGARGARGLYVCCYCK